MSTKKPAAEIQLERLGLSEFIRNAVNNEVYVRGYAFSPKGIVSPAIRLEDGTVLSPSRGRLPRPDIMKVIPECPDPDCGFEFKFAWRTGDVGSFVLFGTIENAEYGETLILDPAMTRQVPTKFVPLRIQVNSALHHVKISGEIVGDLAGVKFSSLQIDGHRLAAKHQVRQLSAAEGDKPARQSVQIVAPLAEQINGELFQIFVPADAVARVNYDVSKSEYKLSTPVPLSKGNAHSALGAIHKATYSTTNGHLEVRGSFVGNFTNGTVKIVLNGMSLPRAARLEAGPDQPLAPFMEAFDAPFSEWYWCDEIDAQPKDKSVLRAELRDAGRLIASADILLTEKTLDKTGADLAPSYFVSALQSTFSTHATAALPSDDPTVVIIFPGDLFTTFGGGSARVVELASYLNTMGYAVGIIDRVSDAEAGTALPDWAKEIFSFRIGLRRNDLAEMVRIALDQTSHEIGSEAVQLALANSLQGRSGTGDLLTRRTDPMFNALAAYFCTVKKADFVVATFAWTAPVLDALPARTCKILDLIDIQYLRGISHKAMTGQDDFITDLDGERAAWDKADYLVAIQQDEKDFVIQSSGKNNVILTGHALPIRRAAEVDKPVVMFIGNFYPPNVRGLRDFLETVWPVIHAAVPEAELHVIGSVSNNYGDVPDGVKILGVVDSVADAYDRAAVIVNPVTFGSGLNIKSVEGLCNGKCLVSTSFGVKGIHMPPETVRVANLDDMGQAVVDLLKDSAARRKYEDAAYEYATNELSPSKIFRELFNTMELRLYS